MTGTSTCGGDKATYVILTGPSSLSYKVIYIADSYRLLAFTLHSATSRKGPFPINAPLDPERKWGDLRLIVNRPNDIANVNVAVCSESDGVHYAPSPDNIALGGIWEFSSEANREEKWPGVTEYHTIPTKCTPLQSVLDASVSPEGKKYYFDFASIDIEGSEISALYGIDYDRISFGLILLEKNGNDDTNRQVHELLSSKGYDEVTQPCGGQNLMYINRSFHRIYAKLRNQNFQLRGSS